MICVTTQQLVCVRLCFISLKHRLLPIAKDEGQHIPGKLLVIAPYSVTEWCAVPCFKNSAVICMWRKRSQVFWGYVQGAQDGQLFYLCMQVQKSHLFVLPLHREVKICKNWITWNVRRWPGYRIDRWLSGILIPVLLYLILQHDWSRSTSSSVWISQCDLTLCSALASTFCCSVRKLTELLIGSLK